MARTKELVAVGMNVPEELTERLASHGEAAVDLTGLDEAEVTKAKALLYAIAGRMDRKIKVRTAADKQTATGTLLPVAVATAPTDPMVSTWPDGTVFDYVVTRNPAGDVVDSHWVKRVEGQPPGGVPLGPGGGIIETDLLDDPFLVFEPDEPTSVPMEVFATGEGKTKGADEAQQQTGDDRPVMFPGLAAPADPYARLQAHVGAWCKNRFSDREDGGMTAQVVADGIAAYLTDLTERLLSPKR